MPFGMLVVHHNGHTTNIRNSRSGPLRKSKDVGMNRLALTVGLLAGYPNHI